MFPRLPGDIEIVGRCLESGAEPGQNVEVASPLAVRDLVERPLEQVHELVSRRRGEFARTPGQSRMEGHSRGPFENRRGAEAPRTRRKKVYPDP